MCTHNCARAPYIIRVEELNLRTEKICPPWLRFDCRCLRGWWLCVLQLRFVPYALRSCEFDRIKYTETIKLCPLDVYGYQFQMYERISFKFSHYQLWLFRNILHLTEIDLIISRAADKAANMSTLKIKSHNINSLCVRHNPNRSSTFKHHWANS